MIDLNRRGLLATAAGAMAGTHFRAPAAQRTIDDFVHGRMQEAGIPGLAIGLARDGRVRLARGYGFADLQSRRPVTAGTLFHIASVTKTVTALAAMMLAEDGRLELDAPIARYLDFPVVNPAYPAEPIRVRHLLMHTSSLSEDMYQTIDFRVRGADSPLSLGRFLRDLLVPGGAHYSASGCYGSTAPGTTWNYVNTGYALLGYLAGRAAGEDLRSYVHRRIFHPLHMSQVAWRVADIRSTAAATPYDDEGGRLAPVPPLGFPDWPAGMLRCSISDFMRFLAACANGGEAFGTRLVRRSTMEEMLAMRKPPGLPTWLTGQGLCWQESLLGGFHLPNHWGGDPGVFTIAYLSPQARSGVAIFSNATASPQRRDAMKSIAAFLLDESARS